MAEPELNPHPLWEAPWLFFFLRSFISFAVIAFLFLGITMKRTTDRHDFAWLVVTVLLLSTSTASYTFIILLLPLVLLLEESGPIQSLFLVVSYALLTLPLHLAWLFPKVWLSVRLVYRYWLAMLARHAAAICSCCGNAYDSDFIRRCEAAHAELCERTRTAF